MNWNYSKYISRKIYRRSFRVFSSRFYLEANHDSNNSILVAGTARSGTTWLADLIGSQIPCRLIFEPFNPDKVRQFAKFHLFQYMRPDCEETQLSLYAEKILTGRFRHAWIDSRNEQLFPRFRLAKEIRANLFLKWLHDRFPHVPLLFIIRHPCAVVLSRMELGWATDSDIEPFLKQDQLIADFLLEKIDLIRKAQTEEEKHAIIWCVSNLVPLMQFHPGELNIVFYENLVVRPEQEFPRIFNTIRHKYHPSIENVIERPSSTTGVKSAVATGENKLSRWKKELSTRQIDNVLKIVAAFGLDHIYRDSLTPLEG